MFKDYNMKRAREKVSIADSAEILIKAFRGLEYPKKTAKPFRFSFYPQTIPNPKTNRFCTTERIKEYIFHSLWVNFGFTYFSAQN